MVLNSTELKNTLKCLYYKQVVLPVHPETHRADLFVDKYEWEMIERLSCDLIHYLI